MTIPYLTHKITILIDLNAYTLSIMILVGIPQLMMFFPLMVTLLGLPQPISQRNPYFDNNFETIA